MKTKIIKLECDWKDVKNVSRTTVNKDHTDKEATSSFRKKILISEHSPIRLIKVRWIWEGIKSWISVHFSRHKFECFISTQRTDRTGINRDESKQSTLVNMDNEANAQNLIDVARKRLCYQSAKETREYMEDFKLTLYNTEETKELSEVLVPHCIYRGGCPEFEECGFWKNFMDVNHNGQLLNIEKRYESYNEWFYKTKGKQL